MFAILLVNALFSAIFPLGKIAMNYCPPFLLIGIRMITAGILLAGYHYFFQKRRFTFSREHWKLLLLLAFFNMYLTNIFEFWGLQYMSSAKACFIYNLAPFFSALLAYFFFNEKITINKITGLLISFFGFAPIFMTPAPNETGLAHFAFLSSAELSVLMATFTGVCGWLVMQHGVRSRGWDHATANSIGMFLGGGMALFNSLFIESWGSVPWSAWQPLSLLVFLLAITTIASYLLFSHLLKKYTATFLTFTGLTGPLFAAFYDWLIFGTWITWHLYIATFLVFAGLYLFYKDEISLGKFIQ